LLFWFVNGCNPCRGKPKVTWGRKANRSCFQDGWVAGDLDPRLTIGFAGVIYYHFLLREEMVRDRPCAFAGHKGTLE